MQAAVGLPRDGGEAIDDWTEPGVPKPGGVAHVTAGDELDAQFQALYASGIIGIVRADRERILDANGAFLAMVGYSREDLEAGLLRWAEMTPLQYAELDAYALQELLATGRCTPFEKEYLRKDGTRVPVQLAAALIRRSPLEWACYVLDLSAPKRAARTQQALDTIIEHVPVGIIVVDQTGRLLLMNEVGRRISGDAPLDETAVADQAGAYELREPRTNRPLEPAETPIARALSGEIVEHFEYVFRPLGAIKDRWVRTVAVPMLGDGRQVLGAVAVFEDVTEERMQDQSREDFLSAAAHDLKAPLTSVKGFAQLLQRRLTREGVLEGEQAAGHLEHITQTARRMEDLINGLLDLARVQEGEPLQLVRTRIDLVELAARVAESTAESTPENRVIVESNQREVIGEWDGARLQRVLENLIGNAIRYSPAGGDVTVAVSSKQRDDGAWAVLAVSDRGIGIPSRDLSRIFDRFFRGSNVVGRFSGTGIGLAGSKQIVEQHGGRIEVASQEGVGTTFTVWLPLDDVATT